MCGFDEVRGFVGDFVCSGHSRTGSASGGSGGGAAAGGRGRGRGRRGL